MSPVNDEEPCGFTGVTHHVSTTFLCSQLAFDGVVVVRHATPNMRAEENVVVDEAVVGRVKVRYERLLEKFSEQESRHERETCLLPVVLASLNRQIALASAVPDLFAAHKAFAMFPLARVQLDGLLRLHALRLVDEPARLAFHVISGKRLSKLVLRHFKWISRSSPPGYRSGRSCSYT